MTKSLVYELILALVSLIVYMSLIVGGSTIDLMKYFAYMSLAVGDTYWRFNEVLLHTCHSLWVARTGDLVLEGGLTMGGPWVLRALEL